MYIMKSVGICSLALLGFSAAQATTVLNVTATFDTTFSNTSFTVQNLSGVAETNVDITSGSVTEMLGTIAAGGRATYSFNEASGPFVNDPGDKALPDTTTYQVSANYLGSAVSTTLFSPGTNLTGGYVDFLGACYTFSTGCSVDPSINYPLTGTVAQAIAPVPLSPSLALFASGLIGFAARVVRRKV